MENIQKTTGTNKERALSFVHPNAAGLDIGAREIWVCVPSDRDPEPVRRFGTFTPDLHTLADWLQSCRVDTVAMESTGVYWIPVFELLEARGLKVYLVNAGHIKNVPGRKSDVLDCQWIQKLHGWGLLSASFRPDGEMSALRGYLRHRAMLLEHRAPHILHMQKALQQMNIQLHHVLSDITGETGLKILRAIGSGERDAVVLAQMRNLACKSSEDEMAKALTGTWKGEHLFALKQALSLYDFYTEQVVLCDREIEKQFATMKPRWQSDSGEGSSGERLPGAKRGSKSKNRPSYPARAEIFRVTGVDLVAVPGISASIGQTVLSEIGTDMGKWPSEKHFGSWLGLAPHNDISGGRVLRSRTLKTNNRAGKAFRQAAASLTRSTCAFGAFYRRKRAQLGPMQALVATAHKISRVVYRMLKDRTPYQEMGAEAYEEKQREREMAYLQKKAAKWGLTLLPQSATPAVAQAVAF